MFRKFGTDDAGARLAFRGGSLFRAPILLIALVPLIAAAMIAGLLPKPSSKAVTLTSEGNSLAYAVGKATITQLRDGVTCSVSLPYTIQTPNPQLGEHLKQTFLKVGRKDVTTDSGDRVSFGIDGDPTVAGNTVKGQVAFWPRCKDVNVQPQESALGDTSQKEDPHVAMAAFGAQPAALPQWARIAASEIIATVVFLAVTTVATIAVGLLEAPLVAAAGATAAALIIKGIAGCIGNAVSVAAMNLITGAAKTWQEHLSSAVSGCITGVLLGIGLGHYVEKIGVSVGKWLRALLGMSPSQLGGPTLATAMERAGLEMATPERPLILAAETAARATA